MRQIRPTSEQLTLQMSDAMALAVNAPREAEEKEFVSLIIIVREKRVGFENVCIYARPECTCTYIWINKMVRGKGDLAHY